MKLRPPTNVQSMALQTAVVYGRLLASHARQLVGPLLKRQNSAKLQLISACCGFSKDFTPAKSKFVFGEDAFFVARNSASDVLGEICFKAYYISSIIVSDRREMVSFNLAYVTQDSVNNYIVNHDKFEDVIGLKLIN